MAKLKEQPITDGAGELRVSGRREPVRYQIQGELRTLAPGKGALRGAVHTSAEIAEQAFRQGDSVLTLEDGKAYRLTMLGHSTGSSTVYFEMKV